MKYVILTDGSYSDYGIECVVSTESVQSVRDLVREYNRLRDKWYSMQSEETRLHRAVGWENYDPAKFRMAVINRTLCEFTGGERVGFFEYTLQSPDTECSYFVRGIAHWLRVNHSDVCSVLDVEEINIS